MEAKKVKYTLAGASSTVRISSDFFPKISSFVGQESRILSAACRSYHDQHKTSFNVSWHAVLIIGSNENDDFSNNVKATVRSYICKCANLKELSMVFTSPMFLFGPSLVNFMQSITPYLSQLKVYRTYECENWFVETTLGKLFYSEYQLNNILTVTDVLQIVIRCVMANDVSVLIKFGLTDVPFGLESLQGFASISDNKMEYISDNEVKACIDFHNRQHQFLGFRRVILKREHAFDAWQLVFLGTFVYTV